MVFLAGGKFGEKRERVKEQRVHVTSAAASWQKALFRCRLALERAAAVAAVIDSLGSTSGDEKVCMCRSLKL